MTGIFVHYPNTLSLTLQKMYVQLFDKRPIGYIAHLKTFPSNKHAGTKL